MSLAIAMVQTKSAFNHHGTLTLQQRVFSVDSTIAFQRFDVKVSRPLFRVPILKVIGAAEVSELACETIAYSYAWIRLS